MFCSKKGLGVTVAAGIIIFFGQGVSTIHRTNIQLI